VTYNVNINVVISLFSLIKSIVRRLQGRFRSRSEKYLTKWYISKVHRLWIAQRRLLSRAHTLRFFSRSASKNKNDTRLLRFPRQIQKRFASYNVITKN